MRFALTVLALCLALSTASGSQVNLTYFEMSPLSGVLPGQSIQLSWTFNGLAIDGSNDWIGLYGINDIPSATSPSWTWDWTGTKSGTKTLTVPTKCTPGTYVVYYFGDSGRTNILAMSSYFRVLSDANHKVTIGSQSNQNIVVNWQVPQGTSGAVNLFTVGGSSPLNSNVVCPISGTATSGSCTIQIPASNAALYEFRLFSNQKNGHMATSTPVSPSGDGGSDNLSFTTTGVSGSAITFSWSNLAAESDAWIGIYPYYIPGTTTDHSPLLIWVFTGGASSGSYTLSLPGAPGYYKAIYYKSGGNGGVNAYSYPIATTGLIRVSPMSVQCGLSAGTTNSNIKNIITIVMENHSFDSYFGNYCQAPTFSNPTCEYGPQCCEKPPLSVFGVQPTVLNDAANTAFDPNHEHACMLTKIDSGRMDGYVNGTSCSDNRNFAVADVNTVAVYHQYAGKYAMADNYFHPAAGASAQNDMYLARGTHVFYDNSESPACTHGTQCVLVGQKGYWRHEPTIGHLLNSCGVSWAFYAEAYDSSSIGCYPWKYDASDNPFSYYYGIGDSPNMQDFTKFQAALTSGSLPSVSYIKPLGTRCEHPSLSKITDGTAFVKSIVDSVLASPYANQTLILILPDESGGFYDHVPPPPTWDGYDSHPNGARTWFIAAGNLVKSNYISHVQMEHTSIIKFIEHNWLGVTGQLGTRDLVVNNIDSVLSPLAGYIP
ncbi:phosphoesterase family-domain-containing protein [Polychytrium aggregatum]|uniref:phosphoesterase family-domain-containing protein n=1 Tax=Polychytrium aggregatum TaxID=110093 RepID=UPI0022FE996C|nr:phosphoesterase family-domain-containing protein [Polychytrium aggregatum]KAI9205257.1 phosphoesterase family-domain-containing protein [Polychytrium aggregatum]